MRWGSVSTASDPPDGRRAIRAAAVGAVFLLAGCAASPPPPGGYRVKGQTYVPLARADGYSETGWASWYGPGFHGRKTSSGEVYDMHGRTAAHKLLPLGTTVRVTHLGSGRQVTARINDRGPFVEGRIIDLSYALARELDLVGQGIARVRVEALSGSGAPAPPSDLPGPFAWQVGAFEAARNAEGLAQALSQSYGEVTVEPFDRGDTVLQRVRVGRYDSADQAHRDLGALRDRGLHPFLVRRD